MTELFDELCEYTAQMMSDIILMGVKLGVSCEDGGVGGLDRQYVLIHTVDYLNSVYQSVAYHYLNIIYKEEFSLSYPLCRLVELYNVPPQCILNMIFQLVQYALDRLDLDLHFH